MSARRARRLRRALLAAALLLAAGPGAAPAAPAWEAVPMPIPPGGVFRTPLGQPGDLSFWSPNRGLMTVGGNNTIPEGIYAWNGQQWHPLATVCGGANARIAWAGPDEFWTIARPSLPRPQQPGLALCHFQDGQVVGSYSTPEGDPDPFREMTAAACLAPHDCWFGGVGGRDGTGQRVGAFHLHWDGTELHTVYNPQGRAVSDLLAHDGQLYESTLVGRRAGDHGDPDLQDAEDPPLLLHRIAGDQFSSESFVPQAFADGGTELRALDGNATTAWAVGGGAVSGPATATALFSARPPLAARLDGGSWHELPIADPELADEDVFADVAGVPGTQTAWVVVRGGDVLGDGGDLQPSVAHVAADGRTDLQALESDDAPAKGAAWKIACPAADDCWMATARGYLYRLVDAAAMPSYARDDDPAFAGTIAVRPNEAAAQAVPDAPPEDDSGLQAPPVQLFLPLPADFNLPVCRPLPSLVTHVAVTVAGGPRLVVRFRLRQSVKVALIAARGGRVVARTPLRRLRAGPRALTVRVSRAHWPTRLRFRVTGDHRRRKPCRPGDPEAITTRAGGSAR
ncbi:MAG TPA: hypothetical protein VF250_12230 [Conexibacter sp.]